MRIGLGVSLATAIAISVATLVVSGGGGGGGGTANFYISPTGSDTSPGTCTQANPCLKPSKAYTVAASGQTVQAACGTYSYNDTIAVDATKTTTSDVVFSPATSATGCWTQDGSMTINGKHITLNSLNLANANSGQLPDSLNGMTLNSTADDITLNSNTGCRFLISDSTNVLIDSGDYGPCIADYGTGGVGVTQGNGGAGNNKIQCAATCGPITIKDTNTHEYGHVWDGVSGPNGQPPHTENLAVFGSDDLTLLRDKFSDCGDSTCILVQANGSGHPNNNLHLIGNWINEVTDSGDGAFTNPQGKPYDVTKSSLTGAYVMNFNSMKLEFGWVGQSNSGVTTSTEIGNLGQNVGNCPTGGVTFSDNTMRPFSAFQGQIGCGTNTHMLVWNDPYPFVNDTAHKDFDLHLNPAASTYSLAADLVSSATCTGAYGALSPLDIDLQTRPVGTSCDTGADDR